MQVQRALLPILVLATLVCVRCATTSSPALPLASEAPSPIDEGLEAIPPPDTLAVKDPPRTIEELQQRLAAVMRREKIAGIGLALVDRNGPIWVGGVGVRDRATQAPVGADTAFRIGSLSKSIIALGVMRLVDQGKLDIDRPLRETIPDFPIDNPWEAEAPVTLAQCLEHTAGFDDVRFNEIFAPDDTMSVREALALNPRSRTIRWKPGTQHQYSNYGYTVAALAIEEAAGEPFDVYLRREILAPMGITDADFGRTGDLGQRLATGYMNADQPVVFRPFAHRPPGALLASASDLAKLVHFWLVRGEGFPPIVSARGLARIETSGTMPYPLTDAQYGLANYVDVFGAVPGRGHDGGMPGFHSRYRYYPSLGVGYAMLLNASYSFRGYFEIHSLIFSYLTKGQTFAPPPIAATTEPPGARFFVPGHPARGLFGFIDRLFNGWRVTPAGNGELVLSPMQQRPGEPALHLLPTADGAYRFEGSCGSSIRFTTNADGRPIMMFGWTYTEAGSERAAVIRLAAFKTTSALFFLAPLWAAVELLLVVLFRRRLLPPSLVIWPAIAGLCCMAFWQLLTRAFFAGVIGEVHPITIAVCANTLLLAFASVATLYCSIRWLRRPDRPSLFAMLVPLACGIAFSAFSLWLGVNGVIGLRTWSW